MSSVVVAVLAVAAYLLVVGLIWRRNGVRYDALSQSRESVVKGIVVPMGVGSVLLAVVTTALGWWGPALTQSPRSGPTWALVVPAVLAVAAALGLTTIDWRSPKARTVLPAAGASAACSSASRRSSAPGAWCSSERASRGGASSRPRCSPWSCSRSCTR